MNNPTKKNYTKTNKIYKSNYLLFIIKLKDLITITLKIDISKELIRIAIERQGFTKKVARSIKWANISRDNHLNTHLYPRLYFFLHLASLAAFRVPILS
jgi:hypothetical protein